MKLKDLNLTVIEMQPGEVLVYTFYLEVWYNE